MIIKIYVKYMEEKEVLEPGNNLEKLSKLVEKKGGDLTPPHFLYFGTLEEMKETYLR